MNVKELIASQPAEAIAAILLDKFRNKPDDRDARERAIKRLIKFIEDLDGIEPVDSGHLILGIFHMDEDGDFLDPCLYCKEELEVGCRADSELAGLEDIEGLAEEISKLPGEEQRKYCVPMEEVFAEFEIPEQTEEEKQEAFTKLLFDLQK